MTIKSMYPVSNNYSMSGTPIRGTNNNNTGGYRLGGGPPIQPLPPNNTLTGHRLGGTASPVRFGGITTLPLLATSNTSSTVVRPANISRTHNTVILPVNPNLVYGSINAGQIPSSPIPLQSVEVSPTPVSINGHWNNSKPKSFTSIAPVLPLPIDDNNISTEEQKGDEPESCPVCLCDYGDGETAIMLQCGHHLGTDCIKCLLKPECPTCRAPITGVGSEVEQQLKTNQSKAGQALILKDKLVNDANGFFLGMYHQLVEMALQNGARPRHFEMDDQLTQEILAALLPNELLDVVAKYANEIMGSHSFEVLCYNLWSTFDHALGLDQVNELKELGAHVLGNPDTFRYAVTENLVNNLLYITIQQMLLEFILQSREKYGREALEQLI